MRHGYSRRQYDITGNEPFSFNKMELLVSLIISEFSDNGILWTKNNLKIIWPTSMYLFRDFWFLWFDIKDLDSRCSQLLVAKIYEYRQYINYYIVIALINAALQKFSHSQFTNVLSCQYWTNTLKVPWIFVSFLSLRLFQDIFNSEYICRVRKAFLRYNDE